MSKKNDIPEFPNITPNKIIENKIYTFLLKNIKSEKDVNDILNLLYEYPERDFYLFIKRNNNNQKNINLNNYGILTKEKEFYYYKHPEIENDFVRISEPNFEWEEKVIQNNPMFIRVKLELSERVKRKLEVKEKLLLEKQFKKRIISIEKKQYIDSLIFNLKELKSGLENAKKYEELILNILKALFNKDLKDPHTQVNTNDNREIIDITFQNESTEDFWHFVKNRYNSFIIIFECKNKKQLGNDDYFQISSRLNNKVGKFGILIVRSKNDLDQERTYRRLNKEEKVILTLSDSDLIKMLNNMKNNENPNKYMNKLLRNLLEKS